MRYTSSFAGLGGLLAAISVAGAQAPKAPSTLAAFDAQAPKANSVQVYLVRQDSSDCTNSTVSNADTPAVSGDITVVTDTNGTTSKGADQCRVTTPYADGSILQ